MSANIAQVMRDTAQIQTLPEWLRKECEQAAGELDRLRAEVEALRQKQLEAFVAGGKWWQFTANKATAWASEVDQMEAEAIRRYMTPNAPFSGERSESAGTGS